MSHDQDLLVRELQQRAEQMHDAPLGLADVKARAGRIRRGRRITSGLAAAAVLAVAAPTGQVVVTAWDQPADRKVAAPTPGPSVASAAEDPVALRTVGLPGGEAPRVAYFDGSELVTPDGRRDQDLVLQGVAPYADGYVGLGYAGAGPEMFFMDRELSVEHRISSGEGFVASPDGSQVAWVQFEGDGSQVLVNAPANGFDPLTWTFPKRQLVTPVGFLDRDTVLYQTDGAKPTIGLAAVGGETRALDGFIKVTAANPVSGLVAGQTSSTMEGGPDDGSCWRVTEPAAGDATMWETCDYALESFSPDGRYVLASDPYQSGLGVRSLSILDARTGEPVVSYQQEPDSRVTLTGFAWEEDHTVLAVAYDEAEGSWSVLRAGTDGRLETSLSPVPESQYADIPFRFATPQ